MSDHLEQRRREALAERNEERQLLHSMLSEPGRGGLSTERAAALQEVFKRKFLSSMPRSEHGLAKDESARLQGLAEVAMTRPKNAVIEVVEEEEEEEKRDEEGQISDGVTMSYTLNGKPCTQEELDEGNIPRRIIKDRNEQRLAQSAPPPATFFLAQIQKQRAEEEEIENLYKAEWGHYRNFEVIEQEEKAMEMNTEEDQVVEDNAEQRMNLESKVDEVA